MELEELSLFEFFLRCGSELYDEHLCNHTELTITQRFPYCNRLHTLLSRRPDATGDALLPPSPRHGGTCSAYVLSRYDGVRVH